MANKRFDKKLNDEHDVPGKRGTEEVMRDCYGAILDKENTKEGLRGDPEGYWDQQYLMPNGDRIKVESERKNYMWWGEEFVGETGAPFQYPEFHIPLRKDKNKASRFVYTSTCGRYSWDVTRDNIDKAFKEHDFIPVNKPCRNRDGTITQEDFYPIPIEYGVFRQKLNGKWIEWKNPSDEE